MNILGIETATSVCGVAIMNADRVLSDRQIDTPNMHSDRLVPMIGEALSESGMEIAAIDAIAVSIGPGSFTGLRIGLSAAKGIAYAARKPLVAVPTLQALADRVTEAEDSTVLVAMLPSRRGEVYWAVYEIGDTERLIRPESLSAYEEVSEWLVAHQPFTLTGTIPSGMKDLMRAFNYRFAAEVSGCSAIAVARRGRVLFERGITADTASVEPVYLHEFVVKEVSRRPGGKE